MLFEPPNLPRMGVADAAGLAMNLTSPVIADAVDRGGGHLVVPDHHFSPTELQVHSAHSRPSLVDIGEDPA